MKINNNKKNTIHRIFETNHVMRINYGNVSEIKTSNAIDLYEKKNRFKKIKECNNSFSDFNSLTNNCFYTI